MRDLESLLHIYRIHSSDHYTPNVPIMTQPRPTLFSTGLMDNISRYLDPVGVDYSGIDDLEEVEIVANLQT